MGTATKTRKQPSRNGHGPDLAPDLMEVMRLLQRFKCHLKPSEIAQMTKLSQRRATSALIELEAHGLVEVAFWRMTKAGKKRSL